MFYCVLHNWYSTESQCPACYRPTEINTSEIKEETKDVFVWTDALVKEFADNLPIDTYAGNVEIEQFKKSKQQPSVSKEWKIVKMITPNGFVHSPDYSNHTCKENSCTIHSVRRLSDMEVFSVGDEVGWGEVGNYYAIITGFYHHEGKLYFTTEVFKHPSYGVSLDAAAKLHKSSKQKLFTQDEMNKAREDAFNAARETIYIPPFTYCYKKLSDYLNSLKK